MNTWGIPTGATVEGQAVYALGRIFFWAAVAVALTVYGLIFWSIVRYRRRGDGLPPQFRKNIPVEIVYTAIPVLIVVGLFILSMRTEGPLDAVGPGDPPLVIGVTGFDWSWQFRYQGTNVTVTGTPERPPEMMVPVGRPVRIVLTSADVMHAFWVPAFLFKRDAFPGVTNRFDVTVTAAGTYVGECAEFCGLDHAVMRFTVRAVTPAAFDRWLRRAAVAARR